MEEKEKNITNSQSFALASKVRDYFQLIKFTLTFLVVFSSVASYLLVPGVSFGGNLPQVLLLFVAGMLITGAANAINQTWERNTDAVMRRTASRPVASKRMSVQEAYSFAGISAVIGVFIIGYFFNLSAALLSLFSLLLYGFVYTPLKRVNSIAVLVGALPGALPCLIGWVAGANEFSAGGWILFSIQFLWQFPHFWAIAWLAHDDYTKAGFKLLPSSGGPTKFTALQTILYSMMMIPIGFLPFFYHISGIVSMWIVFMCNLTMVLLSVNLFRKMDKKSARMVMFGAYFYLMIVFLSLNADKLS